ncbi:MAG: hypothetical protein OJF51_004882 [Nitrospira sp.]|nr:MAG: hypothetical protein OJF51_004882 [Nitrospira sp.]
MSKSNEWSKTWRQSPELQKAHLLASAFSLVMDDPLVASSQGLLGRTASPTVG